MTRDLILMVGWAMLPLGMLVQIVAMLAYWRSRIRMKPALQSFAIGAILFLLGCAMMLYGQPEIWDRLTRQ